MPAWWPASSGNSPWTVFAQGVSLNTTLGIGSGFYLTAALGPGPRDGLMTGLHRRLGVSLRPARAAVELTVLGVGFLLGGTLGIGTVAFALAIGPGVQPAVGVLSTPAWRRLEDPAQPVSQIAPSRSSTG